MRYVEAIIIAICVCTTVWLVAERNPPLDRGKAVSQFLLTHYGMEVPPAQAQYINVVVTTTDVQLSIDQFTVLGD